MELEEGVADYGNKKNERLEYEKTPEEVKEEKNRITIVLTSLVGNIFCIAAFLYFGWSVDQKNENWMLNSAIFGLTISIISLIISYSCPTKKMKLRDYFISGHYVWLLAFWLIIVLQRIF